MNSFKKNERNSKLLFTYYVSNLLLNINTYIIQKGSINIITRKEFLEFQQKFQYKDEIILLFVGFICSMHIMQND